MKRSAIVLPLSVTIAVLLTGVSAAADMQPATNDSARPMTTALKAMVEAALDDAARRTKIDRTKLVVLSAESVTWSDGSLGCPEPGKAYTQALVPGYRIRIQAGAEILDYHAGRLGQLVLCPKGRSVEPAPGGPT
jgi:hypothetical protein